MEKLFNRFEEIAVEPLKYACQWQKDNKGKVVGCMGMYVPEEIIHSAGMLPVIILEKEGPIQEAQAHIQNVMCGYIRSAVDQSVTGEFDFMDCLVVHDACHVIRMMIDVIKRNSNIKRIEPLFFPVTIKKAQSWSYLLKEMYSFIARIEEISGQKISEENLKNSIQLYNKHRQLLKEVYRLRREKRGILSAVQVSNIVKSSMLMPKEEHNALLEELIQKLEKAEVKTSNKTPLVVSGSLCETCDSYVLEAIEEAGGVIVDDDLYIGSRYFITEVPEDCPPIQALALAYVNMVQPCPTRHNPDNNWGDYLTKMVNETGAKGVVTVMVKFCEAHGYGYLTTRRRLKENNVREFLLETEHEINSVGQVKTRMQGFIESINAK